MDRALCYGSRICARRVEQRRHEMHRERIRNMKSSVDTSEPVAVQMDHVRNNLKREQMLEERYAEIDRDNRILLQKMSDIMKPSLQPKPPDGPKTGPQSLNRDLRKKELLRITRENQKILLRIQQAQPVYNHVEWEGEHRKNTSYLRNAAEYPLVLRQPRRGIASSQLIPLDSDGAQTERLNRDQGRPELAGAHDAKYVFKAGKKISGTYYLVEMSTDGRILHISAYNGENQQNLDLVVKEKDHRKLYREANGDYALIAERLRVEGSPARLAILDSLTPGLPHPPSSREYAPVLGQHPVDNGSETGRLPVLAPRGEKGYFRPPSPSRLGLPTDQLTADDMVAAREANKKANSSAGFGFTSAEVQISSSGEPEFHLRGLTPTSDVADLGTPPISLQGTATSGFGVGS